MQSVTFTPNDTTDYNTVTSSVSVTVNKATPIITWTTPSAINYGTALNGAQMNASASVPGSFAYTPTNGTVLNAGTNILSVVFTPTDTVDYSSVTGNVSVTVNKATPIITWTTPSAISYGTALIGAQLNAIANVPGSFAYTPTNGTVLNAGTNILSVVFTPNDIVDYSRATDSVSLVVSPAALTVTANSSNCYYGQTTPVFTGILNGVANGDNITVSFVSSATKDSPVGSGYAVMPIFADPDNRLPNYFLTTNTGTLTVIPAPLTVTASGQKTYGQTLVFGSSINLANIGLQNGETIGSVALLVSGNGGSPTASPGIYTLTPSAATGGSFNPNNYTITYQPGTLTVLPAPLTVIAGNFTRAYGATNPVFSVTFTNFVNGQTLATSDVKGSLGLTVGATPRSPVGFYAITNTLGSLTSTNYSFNLVNGTLTVTNSTPVSFSALSPSQSAAYGAQINLKGTVSAAGPVFPAVGETISVSINGKPQTTSINDTAGDFSLVYNLGNIPATAYPYPITYAYAGSLSPAINTGTTLTVNPAQLAVTASGQSKIYGQTVAFGSGSTNFTSNGLRNSETIGSVTLAVSGNGGSATNVPGNYTITPSAATGGTFNPNNYLITYNTGTLQVSPAPPPTILSLSPIVGSTNGGTTVTITGAGFESGANVRFGLNLASAVVVKGATNLTVMTPPASAGAVIVTVINPDGNAINLNKLFTYGIPPSIKTQPVSQTVTPGSNAVFQVQAGGASPLAYQWFFNGTALPSKIIPTLTVSAANTNSDGFYTVVITNAYGSVTSTPVTFITWPVLTTLYSFTGGVDGGYPTCLVQATNGIFYGNAGNIFSITSIGQFSAITEMFSTNFAPISLLKGNDGTIYGLSYVATTGTLYKIDTLGIGSEQFAFNNVFGQANSNIWESTGALLPGRDGKFYSFTWYSYTTNINGWLVTLPTNSYALNMYTSSGDLTTIPIQVSDYLVPSFQGNDGNLYGEQYYGNSNLLVVFSITPRGALTILCSANVISPDGPNTPLIQGLDGNFYGTMLSGGANAAGFFFRVTPAGEYTNLCSFPGGIGASLPLDTFLQASDGNFYGTTLYGGTYSVSGTVYRVTPSGTLTTLCAFPNTNHLPVTANCMIQATDGNFYGTTANGGATWNGSIFRLSGPLTQITGHVYRACDNSPLTKASIQVGGFLATSDNGGGYTVSNIPPGIFVATISANNYQTYTNSLTVSAATPFLTNDFKLNPIVPTFTSQPAGGRFVACNGSYKLQAACTGGSNLTFQWFHSGIPVLGATNLSYTITNFLQSEGWWLQAATVCGIATNSAVAYLFLGPSFLESPTNQTIGLGQSVTLVSSACGSAPLTFQWYHNGVIVNAPSAHSDVLTLNSVQAADAGAYQVAMLSEGIVTWSKKATLTVVQPPKITRQPISQLVQQGKTVLIGVTATGTKPVTYQWLFNGTNIPGAVKTTLTLPHVNVANAGNYQIVVANLGGSITSRVAALSVAAAGPPTIASIAPGNGSTNGGTTVNIIGNFFEAGATVKFGTSPATSVHVVSQTNITAIIPAAGLGSVSVTVINPDGGTVITNNVFSYVSPQTASPGLISQPTNQVAGLGSTVTLRVMAAGMTSLSYQWQLNGTNIADGGNISGSGLTNLTLANIGPVDAGTYSVIVSNAAGSVTSAGATLSVIMPPSIYAFTDGSDGGNPVSGIIQGLDGNFYGTTQVGGAYTGLDPSGIGFGTVFQLATNGLLNTLYSFTGGNDGANPAATLVQGSDGMLYGTTFEGGTNGLGTVFQISTNGVFTSLYSFTGGSDGANPAGALVQAGDGSLYGTTVFGGPETNVVDLIGDSGYGTVFNITTNGVFNSLYSFTGGSDGGNTCAGVIIGSDGNIYGVTTYGGLSTNAADASGEVGYGTVFQLTTNGTLTTLYAFTGGNDGGNPLSPLTQANNGSFYGTTGIGGTNGYGTIFLVTANGLFASIYSFIGFGDGSNPTGALVQGGDGNLYGTTCYGGSSTNLVDEDGHYGYGTLFKFGTNGVLNTVMSFNGENGANPTAGLVQGSDGNFYGTTSQGGPVDSGTIFELTIAQGAVVADDLPNFVNQLTNQTVMLGSVATLSATVSGALPMFYQWAFNGTAIPGANSSDLEIANALLTNSGIYSLTAINAAGSLVSSNLVLTVIEIAAPPMIITEPISITNPVGSTANFTVMAYGTEPLDYYWVFNNTNTVDNTRITGSESDSLTVDSISSNDEGIYQVIITNDFGSVTSVVATLTMITTNTPAPPAFQSFMFAGTNLNLSWSAIVGSSYQLQCTTDLTQTNWINLGSPISASGSTVTATDSMTNSQRFYRVVLVP
jgi:uncharacterized repeat protein (TIGR03803 family)